MERNDFNFDQNTYNNCICNFAISKYPAEMPGILINENNWLPLSKFTC